MSVSTEINALHQIETIDLSRSQINSKAIDPQEPTSYVSEFINRVNPELQWDTKNPQEYYPPEHSITKFLLTRAGTTSEHTQRACATDIYSLVRDFFFRQFDLPTPEFDDIAALAIAAKVCCEADLKLAKKRLPGKLKEQLNIMFNSALITSQREEEFSSPIQSFIPGFSFERKNGRLKMRLEKGKATRVAKPDISRRDRAFIDILLEKIESSGRSVWPHIFKQEIIGANLAICKTDRKNSNTTIGRRIVHLRKFENNLRDLDILTTKRAVMDTITQPRKEKKLQSSFLPSEMTEILKFLDSECQKESQGTLKWMNLRNRAMIQVLDSTLLRNNAVCSVLITDLSIRKKTLYVRNEKGRKDRLFHLTEPAIEALKEYLPVRKKHLNKYNQENDFPYLFYTKGGKKFNHRDFGRLIKVTAESANIETPSKGSWGPHSWRRGLAAQIYTESGGDIVLVQTLLGHEDPKTTLDYIKPALERIRAEFPTINHPRARRR